MDMGFNNCFLERLVEYHELYIEHKNNYIPKYMKHWSSMVFNFYTSNLFWSNIHHVLLW